MRNLIVLCLAGLVALSSCDKARTILGPPDAGIPQVPTGDPSGGAGGPTAAIRLSHCTPCHGTPGLVVPNADPLVSVAPPRALFSETDPGAHRSHLVDGPFRRAVECASCHLIPTVASAHPAQQQQGRVSFSRLATASWTGAKLAPAWDGSTCAGTYCHGNFKNGANATPAWAGAGGSVVCGSCHAVSPTQGPGGTHPTLTTGQNCGTCHGGAYTNTSVDPVLHLNGVLDGGGESTGGMSCAGCHSAIFSAMNGGVTHATKHTLGAVAGTNDAPTDSGATWANPLSAIAPAARSCVNMCHGDHPHDLSSPATATHENNAYLDASSAATRADGTANRIGVGGTGGTPNRMKSDYDGTQANGGMCVSCHQYPIAITPAPPRPVIAKAAFDASAHDYTSNVVGATTYAWSYALHDGGLFARDCTKCHASNVEGTTPQVLAAGATAVHFGDNASLLSGTKNPGGVAAGFVCYNCHGSTATPASGAQGNRSGKDIQSQIAHATAAGQSGHPANSDTVHDSVAEYANTAFGNALGVAAGTGQRHASCLDCHDPHQAKPTSTSTRIVGSATNGNVAGPALQGAWGVKWTGTLAAWGTPTSANFTKTPITAGTDLEATLCFKCHSAYYGTLPTSPSSSPAFAETDQAKEFNSANAGFHPVLASASGNLGATSNFVTGSGWTRTSLMTCTDCHESDVTADPNGPHGSGARFILKGTNTKWDATLTLTGGAMPSGTFCANCHDPGFAGSRYSAHTNGNHGGVPCMNCHAAIPHGGPRPGMLVDAAGTANGCVPIGGVIADWDTAAPYSNASAVDKLCIKSYPATNTTTWARSNCGCNGSGH